MKKLLYLGFCLVLAMAFGCAITDYPVITDNAQGKNRDAVGETINTNGKAHISESSQIAFIYSDGTDELFSFVDQKASGDQTLTTYNNYDAGGDGATFHSDLYCNPDWQGCSVWTAPNPTSGDDPFDGNDNSNCFGFRSLSILLSTGRYYGECGRTKLSLQDRLGLLGEGILQNRYGKEGLLYNVNAGVASIQLDNNQGVVSNLPFRGNMEVWVSGDNSRLMTVDATNPLLGTVGRAYANWLAQSGADKTTASVCYLGICADFDIAGNGGPSTPSRVMANVNAHF